MSNNPVYLLSIRGTLAPATLEEARTIHNSTAGAPDNVAAARALSDLSHMVYVPIDPAGPAAGELLFLDLWNNLEGLNKFFADPHVQQGGSLIFSQRDPVVWAPAEELFTYSFPAPTSRPQRFIGVVRGKVRSRADAASLHNALVGRTVNQARAAGAMSHQAYFRLAAPGSPEELEFFAVDTWFDAAGMNHLFEDPNFMQGFMGMFAEQPVATVWVHPAGEWVEW